VGKDRIEEVVGDRAAVAAVDAQARASSSGAPEQPASPLSAPAAAGKLATQVQPRAIVEVAAKEDLEMLADAEGESAAAAKVRLTAYRIYFEVVHNTAVCFLSVLYFFFTSPS
jgi:hypothetical protein